MVTGNRIRDLPEAPPEWPGSLPEYLVYRELIRQGKVDGLDFTYQAKQFGGRLERGGLIVDFLFSNPPDLAVNVQGAYFHYRNSLLQHNDRVQRALLESQGIRVIYIDEEDILSNVKYFVTEALNFRDHSYMVGR